MHALCNSFPLSVCWIQWLHSAKEYGRREGMSLRGISYKKTDFLRYSFVPVLWEKSIAMLGAALWKYPCVKEQGDASGQLPVRNWESHLTTKWVSLKADPLRVKPSDETRAPNDTFTAISNPKSLEPKAHKFFTHRNWDGYWYKSLSLGATCYTIIKINCDLWPAWASIFSSLFLYQTSIVTCL